MRFEVLLNGDPFPFLVFDAISFRFVHHSLDIHIDFFPLKSFLVNDNRYFVLLVRRFSLTAETSRGMSSASMPNVIRGREKSHRKKIAALLSRPLLTSFGCPFGRLFSIFFVFSSIPFADQHPDAYPNGLTIPIEPYPIRAPMARGRKGISRHGIRPPVSVLILWADVYVLTQGSFLPTFLFFLLQVSVQSISGPIAP